RITWKCRARSPARSRLVPAGQSCHCARGAMRSTSCGPSMPCAARISARLAIAIIYAAGHLQTQQGVAEADVVVLLDHLEAGLADQTEEVVAVVETTVAVGQAGEVQRGGVEAVGIRLELLDVPEHLEDEHLGVLRH